MLVEVILTLVLFCFILFYLFGSKRPKNFPPGPPGLPILGNALQLGVEHFQAYVRMRETYGDIIGVKLGPSWAVVLNDHKLIREAFNEMTFSGRPHNEVIYDRCGGGKARGIIFTEGQDWKEQRRFTLKTLRDFGFGRKSMELMVQDEVKELIESFKKLEGKPMSTSNKFNAAVLNSLWTIITGKRHSHDDPILNELISRLTSGIQQSGRFRQIFFFFPDMRKLPILNRTFLMFRNIRLATMAFLIDAIKQHKDSYQENLSRDFIDSYLEEIKNTTDPNSSFYQEEGEKQLAITMLDLFIAGAETTSTTLTWVFRLLSIYQDVQDKLYEEIKGIVGDSRFPSLADRPNMPYTEAVIQEVMRFSSMVPLGVNHKTVTDVEFHGYHIPKDTIILPNLYWVMHDPQVWGDPENFRPSRFLSLDGQTVLRHDALMPFSIGRRICLGESLAKDELFLFTSSLFQRFHVKTDPREKDPKPEHIPAFILAPKPHQLILIDRQK